MNRGILVTAYADLKDGVTDEMIRSAYEKHYADEYFIRLLDKDVYPETRWVEGRTGRVIMMGAIDNLVKGAAGQAIQNMNIMFGFDEKEGLMGAPVFP